MTDEQAPRASAGTEADRIAEILGGHDRAEKIKALYWNDGEGGHRQRAYDEGWIEGKDNAIEQVLQILGLNGCQIEMVLRK